MWRKTLSHFALALWLPWAGSAVAGPADSDGDGLTDDQELFLGTDPRDVDTDCDALDDAAEVGPDPLLPLDADGDGRIDAVESRRLDSDLDGARDSDDPSPGWQPSCARFRPFAVLSDGSEPTRLEVRIVGGMGVSMVEVGNTFPTPGILVDGIPFPQSGATIQLHDDGTHGDLDAGDGVWSRGGITASNAPLPPADAVFDTIVATDAGGTSVKVLGQIGGGSSSRIALGVVDPGDLEPPRQVAADVQAVRHLVNLVAPLSMLEVQRFLMFEAPWSPQDVTQRFYQVYPDRFDFVFLTPGEPAFRANAGVSGVVSNAVQGIGRAIADNTAVYGSDGRLQAVIGRNHAATGPNLHELIHRWAQSLDPSLGFGQCAPAHWGYSGTGIGALGGFDPQTLFDDGDGGFEVGLFPAGGRPSDHDPFNRLELYLAGWLGPDDVLPMPMPFDVECASVQCVPPGCDTIRFDAGGTTTLSIDDIVAIHGDRVPDVFSSQKDFDLAWIVVSAEPLTETELAYFGWQADYLGRSQGNGGFFIPFEVAAGGLATLDTAIEVEGAAGEVPELFLSRNGGGTIELRWDPSCRVTDADYAVYEGTIGDFASYAPRVCSTGGKRRLDVTGGTQNAFFLVVPLSADREGGYGADGSGDRPPSSSPCLPSIPPACP